MAWLSADSDSRQGAWLMWAGFLGASGVAMGAFGAHWLEGAVESWDLSADEQQKRLQIWETAVRYQLYHALALMALAALAGRLSAGFVRVVGVCFTVGVTIFSGCLYVLVLSGVKVLGAIVPLGGALMIVGWTALMAGAIVTKANRQH